LLLRHAVDSAQPPDEIAAMDAYYFSLRKQASKNVERDAIVRIIESRH
jgi:hypothetical protein